MFDADFFTYVSSSVNFLKNFEIRKENVLKYFSFYLFPGGLVIQEEANIFHSRFSIFEGFLFFNKKCQFVKKPLSKEITYLTVLRSQIYVDF